MAETAALFFRGNRTYGFGGITFDLILSESHNFKNKISTHPIENGSEITDHIQNELLSGSMTGLITNFSIYVDGLESNRAQDAFDTLEQLWRERTLMTFVTVMRVYVDVALVSAPVRRDSSTGEAIAIEVSFREVKTVTLKKVTLDVTINVPNMEDDLSRESAVEVDVGRTTAAAGDQQTIDSILSGAQGL